MITRCNARYPGAVSSHTVDWTTLRVASADASEATGLRERRKRATRNQLIDTATAMCLERGFDSVTVTQIAKIGRAHV